METYVNTEANLSEGYANDDEWNKLIFPSSFDCKNRFLGFGMGQAIYLAENVDSKVALAMLERNDRNRPIDRTRVKSYRNQMERGDFDKAGIGQRISFDSKWHLTDGQHRLLAISELENFSMDLLIFVGVDDIKNIDVGKKRSTSDAVSIESGKTISATEIGAAKLLAGFATGRVKTYTYLGENALIRVYDLLKDDINSVIEHVFKGKKIGQVGMTSILLASYVFAYRYMDISLEELELFHNCAFDRYYPRPGAYCDSAVTFGSRYLDTRRTNANGQNIIFPGCITMLNEFSQKKGHKRMIKYIDYKRYDMSDIYNLCYNKEAA